MKDTTTSSSQPVVLDVDKTSEIVSAPEQSSQQSKHKNQLSSQMQLLGLAKQFVIDGSLLPIEKQMPLEDRSKKRERTAELRKQQNMESIIQRAIHYCADDKVTDRVDQDWFASFIELAEHISNKTMQDLWAKILAGEIAAPGSFSLKSLQAFRTMSIHEAKLFAKACSLAVSDNHRKSMRLISGASQLPGIINFFTGNRQHPINLSAFGLSYAELLTLADNHLIFIQETETPPIKKGETLTFDYNGEPFSLVSTKQNVLLSFYKFTPIGNELAQLIANKPDAKYRGYVKQEFTGLFSVQ
ncbi:TIGR03899 family protein [Thalassotalea sediminis]|uniref:TIGR03899 family protein n=1 Tax=Thalassotalea sediminis TaxID=1759089 RepID=UPI002573DB5C|nr:TIGR03899 family protein [Thalassotalea sediminis]